MADKYTVLVSGEMHTGHVSEGVYVSFSIGTGVGIRRSVSAFFVVLL